MSRQAVTRICMVSPDLDRVMRLRSDLATRTDWGAEIVYDTCDGDTMLLNLHRFNPAVFVIDLELGPDPVNDLVQKLVRAGFAQFLFVGVPAGHPELPGEVIPHNAPVDSLLMGIARLAGQAMRERTAEPSAAGRSRRPTLVTLFSPKGGTGKTLLACALAIQYGFKGLRVALVDLAMYGGVGPSLSLSKRDTGLSRLIDVMAKEPALLRAFTDSDILRECLTHYPVGDHRLDLLLPAPPLKMSGFGATETEGVLHWLGGEPYDVVIVDTSSEISERAMAAMKMADHVLLVLTPDPSAAWATLSIQDLLTNLNTDNKVHLVLNRSVSSVKVHDYEDVLGYRVIGQIPETDHPWEQFVGRSLSLNYSAAGFALKQLVQQIHKVYSPIELPSVKR